MASDQRNCFILSDVSDSTHNDSYHNTQRDWHDDEKNCVKPHPQANKCHLRDGHNKFSLSLFKDLKLRFDDSHFRTF